MEKWLTTDLEERVAAALSQLTEALGRHGRLVYSNSLVAEAMVPTDLIWSHLPEIDVFTNDTGRLHEETHQLLATLERRYQRRLRVVYPDAQALERLPSEQGTNGFYGSLEARLTCCRVRKVEPFKRAIAGFPAWSRVCGASSPRGVRARRVRSGMPSTDSTRSARCSSGAKLKFGNTSARTTSRTTRCTIANFRALAACPALVRSSPAKSVVRDAGGGSSWSLGNAGYIRDG